jgi:hypothetical protein
MGREAEKTGRSRHAGAVRRHVNHPSFLTIKAKSGRFDRKPENQQTSSMKMTLDLPPGLVREMKLRAVNEHRKLKDVAAELLRRGLSAKPLPEAREAKGAMPFPFFPAAVDAPASHMTAEELLALEQETLHQEDIQRLGRSL